MVKGRLDKIDFQKKVFKYCINIINTYHFCLASQTLYQFATLGKGLVHCVYQSRILPPESGGTYFDCTTYGALVLNYFEVNFARSLLVTSC